MFPACFPSVVTKPLVGFSGCSKYALPSPLRSEPLSGLKSVCTFYLRPHMNELIEANCKLNSVQLEPIDLAITTGMLLAVMNAELISKLDIHSHIAIHR